MRSRQVQGALIRQMREESGSGLNRFAYKVGISGSHLSRIENGHTNPSPEMTNRIAVALGVTISDITTIVADAAVA